jgi:DNA polymerase alpha subunit A
MLELFILKNKIKGPCWLTIKDPVQVPFRHRRSWCKQELVVKEPKNVSCTIEDLNKTSPPLVSLTLSCKMARSAMNTNEIAMISCIVQNKINQDGPTREEKF